MQDSHLTQLQASCHGCRYNSPTIAGLQVHAAERVSFANTALASVTLRAATRCIVGAFHVCISPILHCRCSQLPTLKQCAVQGGSGTAGLLSICAHCVCVSVLQAPLVAVGPADPAVVVASMRRNMEALDQLSSERAGETCIHPMWFMPMHSTARRGVGKALHVHVQRLAPVLTTEQITFSKFPDARLSRLLVC